MWICFEGSSMNLTPYNSLQIDFILINSVYLVQINNTGNIQAWFWPPVGYCGLARLKYLKIILKNSICTQKIEFKELMKISRQIYIRVFVTIN